MVYSAALWPDDPHSETTLEAAQEAKMDWHIAAAGLRSGDRLLDIGCGWGSLMQRSVERHHLSEVVGLTLSDAQATWIREKHNQSKIIVEVCAWQDFVNVAPFDAIVSIGALEHFARPSLDAAAKLRCYQEFFRFCSENLVEGGKLSLQSITWMNMKPENQIDNLPLHLFPESNLPYTIEVMNAADPYFHLMDYHNCPQDYSKTLNEWIKGLRARRSKLSAAYGTPTVRRYVLGFAQFVLGFDHKIIGLSRFAFRKRSVGSPRTK